MLDRIPRGTIVATLVASDLYARAASQKSSIELFESLSIVVNYLCDLNATYPSPTLENAMQVALGLYDL